MVAVLQLCYNRFEGNIPNKLGSLKNLAVLALQSNQLRGEIPTSLKRLNEGFRYENNPGLCGTGFPPLALCSDSSLNPTKPEPFGQGSNHLPTKDISKSANIPHQLNENRRPQAAAVVGVIGLFVILAVAGLFTFSWYRRRKQQIGNTIDISKSRVSTDQPKEGEEISLLYSM
nr:LRR receptor-like serine/threonine-protein kinase GSO1 [Ipomoea batatas]